jgi:hypothetical protein
MNIQILAICPISGDWTAHAVVVSTIASLSKWRSCQHEQLILATFSITLEIIRFVLCVEDHHKLIQTQFLIQSSPRQSDVRGDKNVTCLRSLMMHPNTITPSTHPTIGRIGLGGGDKQILGDPRSWAVLASAYARCHIKLDSFCLPLSISHVIQATGHLSLSCQHSNYWRMILYDLSTIPKQIN